MRDVIEFMVCDENGDEMVLEMPARFEVCPRCRGKGKHVNPSVDGNGLSSEDFAEDPDFAQDYFAGMYDVTCHDCDGLRVVHVPDEDACDPAVLAKYHEKQAEEAASRAEERAERRYLYGSDY